MADEGQQQMPRASVVFQIRKGRPMHKHLAKFGFAALVLSLASVSTQAAPQRGPTQFYDQNGGFRGYAWCRKAGMDIVDCNYYTQAQCGASGAGYLPAYCVPNPFSAQGSGDRPRRGNSRQSY
jgi:hypothetical protein